MAVKMSAARLRKNPTVVVQASRYDKERHGGVMCVDCRCAVEGVRAYSRQVFDYRVHVPAFFRLPRAGVTHGPDCQFNVDRIVERIVAQSREITNFDSEAPLLFARRSKGLEFRLHIVMDALHLADPGWQARSKSAGYGETRLGTKYIRSEQLLRPYLKTAKAVLSLMAQLQDRSEAEFISLRYRNFIIPWNEFFFDLTDYGELYQYLSKLRDSSGEQRPIAIVVKVIKKPILTRGGWWIRGRTSICTPDERGIRPVLYVVDRELADTITEKVPAYVLVCAAPKLRKFGPPPTDPRFKAWADIALNIFSAAQVCPYSPTPPNNYDVSAAVYCPTPPLKAQTGKALQIGFDRRLGGNMKQSSGPELADSQSLQLKQENLLSEKSTDLLHIENASDVEIDNANRSGREMLAASDTWHARLWRALKCFVARRGRLIINERH